MEYHRSQVLAFGKSRAAIITMLALSTSLVRATPLTSYRLQHLDEVAKGPLLEVERQFVRFQSLANQGKLGEAESVLALIKSYKDSPDLRREHAQLALLRKDYTSAFPILRSYFDGDDPKGSRSVYGAEDTRIWYWFLITQRGDLKKADEVLKDLFHDPVRLPYSVKYLEPREVSSSKFAQAYMYMAGYYSTTGNYFRSQKYIGLAKKVDPKVKVDLNFFKGPKLYAQSTLEKYEAQEDFPMLDHTLFQKQLGKPVRIY